VTENKLTLIYVFSMGKATHSHLMQPSAAINAPAE